MRLFFKSVSSFFKFYIDICRNLYLFKEQRLKVALIFESCQIIYVFERLGMLVWEVAFV